MIKKGKVVSLTYQLKNDKGEELDRADKADPFTYLHGYSQIVPGLENALEKSVFPADMPLKPDVQFEASLGEDNGEAVFTIKSVDGDKVLVDGNHPLAGQILFFDVEILDVRDATKEELSHGHVHGADGGHEH